jgi:hypothetical protein
MSRVRVMIFWFCGRGQSLLFISRKFFKTFRNFLSKRFSIIFCNFSKKWIYREALSRTFDLSRTFISVICRNFLFWEKNSKLCYPKIFREYNFSKILLFDNLTFRKCRVLSFRNFLYKKVRSFPTIIPTSH